MPCQTIALVSENAGPPGERAASDQSTHVGALAAALAASGREVTIWTRREGPEHPAGFTTADGVTVRRVDAGRALTTSELLPTFATALHAAWEGRPPQLAHAHSWTSGLATLAAVRRLDVPVVQTFHGLSLRRRDGGCDAGSTAGARAERHLAYSVDRIIATSSDERNELLRIGAPRERIGVVPSGVDVEEFTPHGPAHPRGDQARLVVVGGLARGSGADEAVVALTAVPDAELVVAGGAGAADPDMGRLRALARSCKVADRVRFIGPVPRREVAPLLRSADVVVCLPWSEPHGIVALAAMACGRPVVASAVGALADAVVDGVTGMLVPPHRPRQAGAALRHVLASPTRAMAMGTAGRDRAETRYGWERAADATLDVYAGLCGDPAGSVSA
jgi:glycosyltransferase involved in cell wall biosynthesis